jgi:hypothetical protein
MHQVERRRTTFFVDQFQIALPPGAFGIMLRANWPLTRWAASHPKTVRRRRKRLHTPEGEEMNPPGISPADFLLRLSSPAKAGDPVRRGLKHNGLWNTGSPALAGDDIGCVKAPNP